MNLFTKYISFALFLMLLTGCGANYNTVYRNQTLDEGGDHVITVDAKQRSILTAVHRKETTRSFVSHDGKVKSHRSITEDTRRFCSEPSPDVFSVIAQAMSITGTFGQSPDPKTIEAALKAAFSTSEQGSTIPRTQTINMLRELMFRTCERYLSGGYDELELSVQAVRDQRLMVSILAIEQLTGVVAPKPVILANTASASAGATGDAIVRLDDARKENDKAQKNLVLAQSDFDEVNTPPTDGDKKPCDEIKELREAGEEVPEGKNEKAEACDKAQAKLTTATGKAAKAAAAHQELALLARSGGVSAVTSASSKAPGGIDRIGGAQNVKDVADVVNNIVSHNFTDSTEVMLFCLRILRDQKTLGALAKDDAGQQQRASIIDTCTNFLKADIDLATTQKLNLIKKAGAGIQNERDALFEEFWSSQGQKLAKNPTQLATFVSALRDQLAPTERLKADCFTGKTSKTEFAQCFHQLSLMDASDLVQ